MIKKNRNAIIVLFGPYPPPYGGVSIHVQRLQYLLSNRRKIDCTICDTTRFSHRTKTIKKSSPSFLKNWPKIFQFRKDIIHIHNSGLNLKKIFVLSLLLKIRGNKIIVTYHSLRDDIKRIHWYEKKMFHLNLKFVSHYIVVNRHIKQKLLNIGIPPKKISVIPAFLPPIIRQKDIDEIPNEIMDFINNHKPVISANAYTIIFHNNQDLYGIDMCIELCAELKKDYPNVGFVFCLPNVGDRLYFEEMKKRIKVKKIENNFLFVTKPYQFYPILVKSDLFLRPTNTDGDAISIREAIFLQVPVVASNVVKRPNGVVLFDTRDSVDFYSKVKNIFDNYGKYAKTLETLESEDNISKIINIYKGSIIENKYGFESKCAGMDFKDEED